MKEDENGMPEGFADWYNRKFAGQPVDTARDHWCEEAWRAGFASAEKLQTIAIPPDHEILHEDYRTHARDWLNACVIARDEAGNDASRTYWQHQINVLQRLMSTGE